MPRLIKKIKETIGVSPDELIFTGSQKIDEVLLRIIDFDANNLDENAVNKVEDVLKYKDTETVTWFNIDGLHNKSIIDRFVVY